MLCPRQQVIIALKPCLLGLVSGGKQGSDREFLDGKPGEIGLLSVSMDPRRSHPILDLNYESTLWPWRGYLTSLTSVCKLEKAKVTLFGCSQRLIEQIVYEGSALVPAHDRSSGHVRSLLSSWRAEYQWSWVPMAKQRCWEVHSRGLHNWPGKAGEMTGLFSSRTAHRSEFWAEAPVFDSFGIWQIDIFARTSFLYYYGNQDSLEHSLFGKALDLLEELEMWDRAHL